MSDTFDSPWRCPVCGGHNLTSGRGAVCTWTAPGSLFRPCPGRRRTRYGSPNARGRGIGNMPPGYRSDSDSEDIQGRGAEDE